MENMLLSHLAEFACHENKVQFPDTARRFARHCLLDFAGVAIAGADEPVVNTLREFALKQAGAPESSLFCQGVRLPMRSAALIAGAAGHALDFDDNNLAMQGHPTAPVLGALLPVAEHLQISGTDLIDAFIVGYEVESRIGAGFGLDHYAAGFHATATLGTFGAAAACARILGLSPAETAHALALAASQASGLKGMFGTMGKVAQVGMASEKGLVAALLAKHGFTGPVDAIEGKAGFAVSHSATFAPEEVWIRPGQQLEVERTIFKYHASCFETHAIIEAIRAIMREHMLSAADIRQIDIFVYEEIDSVCNIAEPDSGLGLKFSLRAIAALAALGLPTESISTFSDEMARDARMIAFRDRTTVHLCKGYPQSYGEVRLTLKDGRVFERAHDSAVVNPDLEDQEQRLRQKFSALVGPVLGEEATHRLAGLILDMDRHDVSELVSSMNAAMRPELAQCV